MARIRTIKPEAFTSETLAALTLTAERTFFGLLTQADDQGRHRDNAAVIAGVLWPLRPAHTSADVEDDLRQLHASGLVCRYRGCDGKRYLHVTGWSEHQRINRPSPSRVPVCPVHAPTAGCPACKQDVCRALLPAGAPNAPHGALTEPALPGSGNPDQGSTAPPERGADAPPQPEPSTDVAAEPPRAVVPSSGADPHRPDGARGAPPARRGDRGPAPSAHGLVAEYVGTCRNRPPNRVLKHLGQEIGALLDDGVAAEHVRAGLGLYSRRPMHPSVLPSLVNEAMNAPPHKQPGPGAAHRPWTNPVDPGAYEEAL